ncbi:MAG: neutral zinc metallopeptidase [Microthrixaceae bacterium]
MAVLVALGLIVVILVVRLGDRTDGRRASGTSITDVANDRSAPGAGGLRAGAPVPEISVHGDSASPEDRVVKSAIADVQAFWVEEFPQRFGRPYQPVSGGFYAVTPQSPVPPCANSTRMVEGNAYYCSAADVVVWDARDLVPTMARTYGDLSVAIVFAHELGHAVQVRTGFQAATVTMEQQADCYAGAWVRRVRDGDSPYFQAGGDSLQEALAGFLALGDEPGVSGGSANAHGSAFDRITAFSEGVDQGTARCAQYDDNLIGGRLVELPFNSAADAASGGNMAYGDLVSATSASLDAYWSTTSPTSARVSWHKPNRDRPFDASKVGDTPRCDGTDTKGLTVFYCPAQRYIAYDNAGLFPNVYDKIGDFAVSMLYAEEYSVAVMQHYDIVPSSRKAQALQSTCLTGSWAGALLRGKVDVQFSLSPGDLDEAVTLLLAMSSTKGSGLEGSGFDVVAAFRSGVTDGVTACG